MESLLRLTNALIISRLEQKIVHIRMFYDALNVSFGLKVLDYLRNVLLSKNMAENAYSTPWKQVVNKTQIKHRRIQNPVKRLR